MKNGIHCEAIADNLTKLYQEYFMSGLLPAFFSFLLFGCRDKRVKKGEKLLIVHVFGEHFSMVFREGCGF